MFRFQENGINYYNGKRLFNDYYDLHTIKRVEIYDSRLIFSTFDVYKFEEVYTDQKYCFNSDIIHFDHVSSFVIDKNYKSVHMTYSDGIRITNVNIDVLTIDYSYRIKIENCNIGNLIIKNCSDIIITDCKFENMKFNSCNNVKIDKCIISKECSIHGNRDIKINVICKTFLTSDNNSITVDVKANTFVSAWQDIIINKLKCKLLEISNGRIICDKFISSEKTLLKRVIFKANIFKKSRNVVLSGCEFIRDVPYLGSHKIRKFSYFSSIDE